MWGGEQAHHGSVRYGTVVREINRAEDSSNLNHPSLPRADGPEVRSLRPLAVPQAVERACDRRPRASDRLALDLTIPASASPPLSLPYENPIQRPPQSTPAQSAREITAVTVPERGAFSISFASATFRRTVKVKAIAETKDAIFTQKGTL